MLEDACKDDEELRHVLGDSIGNPELMVERVTAHSLPCLVSYPSFYIVFVSLTFPVHSVVLRPSPIHNSLFNQL